MVSDDLSLLRPVHHLHGGVHTGVVAHLHLALDGGVPMVLHGVVRPAKAEYGR